MFIVTSVLVKNIAKAQYLQSVPVKKHLIQPAIYMHSMDIGKLERKGGVELVSVPKSRNRFSRKQFLAVPVLEPNCENWFLMVQIAEPRSEIECLAALVPEPESGNGFLAVSVLVPKIGNQFFSVPIP